MAVLLFLLPASARPRSTPLPHPRAQGRECKREAGKGRGDSREERKEALPECERPTLAAPPTQAPEHIASAAVVVTEAAPLPLLPTSARPRSDAPHCPQRLCRTRSSAAREGRRGSRERREGALPCPCAPSLAAPLQECPTYIAGSRPRTASGVPPSLLSTLPLNLPAPLQCS